MRISFCSLVSGIRLDRFLAEELSGFSRSYLQKLIQQGEVLVNQKVCLDKNYDLQPHDEIQVHIPPTQPLELVPQSIHLDILYEDDYLLVINKPVGLVVHPAPGHVDHTLVNALLAHCPHLSGINGIERPGIVHRLDKDTSGVMVVAKTDHAHHHLQQQLQTKTARRRYLGIVEGIPKPLKGTISTGIARHPKERQKMAVVPQGKLAITHWQVLARGKQAALLQFDLETGRTHQIRVHCAYMGHAILNDPVYGQTKPTLQKYLAGQALHAWELQFVHPATAEIMLFTAPLPWGFGQVLRHLQLPTALDELSLAK
ncbi:MAG: RluA family pseudouridine synthase [Pseudanabaenaceae cyanobacterium]